jgi:hypothetical protein
MCDRPRAAAAAWLQHIWPRSENPRTPFSHWSRGPLATDGGVSSWDFRRLIGGGVFTVDTIVRLHGWRAQYEALAAFEGDPESFVCLDLHPPRSVVSLELENQRGDPHSDIRGVG